MKEAFLRVEMNVQGDKRLDSETKLVTCGVIL